MKNAFQIRSAVARWAATAALVVGCAFGQSGALAGGPVAAGIDSFATLPSDFGYFSFTPIPASFFDPGSDPFGDIIGLQGLPLVPGATTDTVVARLEKAKFHGPLHSDSVPIEIIDLSLTSVAPVTVTYAGGNQPELWDVQVGLTPATQSAGLMTLAEQTKGSGSFDLSVSVFLRLSFTRLANGATRVLDLPPLDFHASAVPWTRTTTDTTIIHAPGLCPACDSPDGVPANMFLSGPGVTLDLVPAMTIP